MRRLRAGHHRTIDGNYQTLINDVLRACIEGALQAVILSPFASLRVNFAKDPGSSRESVNRVNYGGSSPKIRAQNDSAFEFFRNLVRPALRGAWGEIRAHQAAISAGG